MKIQAVVFDMDGVLIDSEVHWFKLSYKFLKGLTPLWNKEYHRNIIGMNTLSFYNYVKENFNIPLTLEQFTESYQEISRQVYTRECSLLPGVMDLLEFFSERKIPMAIASSSLSMWIGTVLDRFHIRPYFRFVVSGEDVGERGKPDPHIFLTAARKLGVEPGKCLAIEDSANGVNSAKSAGMKCIGLTAVNMVHQDLSKADMIVGEIGELFSMEDFLKLFAGGKA